MIYWDNAATTWPKPMAVTEAMSRALTRYGANPGRGGHTMGMAASREVYRCRETAAEFFHLDNPGQVVFTLNCTMAMNMALKGILRTSGRVVVSDLEHNAVMRPLHVLSPGRPIYDVAQVTPGDDDQTVEAFRRCITPFTRAIVCTHASNVFGVQLPIRRLGELAREHDLLFVVDAAQTAGHLPVDFQAFGLSAMAVPGHKGLLGPGGVGALLLRDDFAQKLTPLIAGGTGSASDSEYLPPYLPDRFESGTANLPGCYGWEAALRFIEETGVDVLRQHERALCARFLDGLADISGVRLVGPRNMDRRVGVISVDFLRRDNAEMAYALEAQYGILTRCGLHCAPSAHKTLGTFPQGTVRFSLGWASTEADVDAALAAIRALA